MAGSKSAYLAKTMLDFVMGAGSYTPPANVYLALSTAAFTPTATGAAMSEVSATGYARLAVVNDNTQWPAAAASSPSTKSNTNELSFATASSDWGTILSMYVVDAATAGNVLYGCDLINSQVINTGDTARFAAGALTFAES